MCSIVLAESTSSNWICNGALNRIADRRMHLRLITVDAPVFHVAKLETPEHGDALLGPALIDRVGARTSSTSLCRARPWMGCRASWLPELAR
jgi:hypothetical protein